jgi:hypothetical protein
MFLSVFFFGFSGLVFGSNIFNALTRKTPSPYEGKDLLFQAIESANIEDALKVVKKYPEVIKHFDSIIFRELLKHSSSGKFNVNFWSLFELLKPSFHSLSSHTSPLIHSIFLHNADVFDALLALPTAKDMVEFIDEDGFTALMCACKKGKFYHIFQLIPLSKQVINVKDPLHQKTALHYLCEFSRLENEEELKQKLAAAELLFSSGAIVSLDAAKYELISPEPLCSLVLQKLLISMLPIKIIQLLILSSFEIVLVRLWPDLYVQLMKNPVTDSFNHNVHSIVKFMFSTVIEYNMIVNVNTGDSIVQIDIVWIYFCLVVYYCYQMFK